MRITVSTSTTPAAFYRQRPQPTAHACPHVCASSITTWCSNVSGSTVNYFVRANRGGGTLTDLSPFILVANEVDWVSHEPLFSAVQVLLSRMLLAVGAVN